MVAVKPSNKPLDIEYTLTDFEIRQAKESHCKGTVTICMVVETQSGIGH